MGGETPTPEEYTDPVKPAPDSAEGEAAWMAAGDRQSKKSADAAEQKDQEEADLAEDRSELN